MKAVYCLPGIICCSLSLSHLVYAENLAGEGPRLNPNDRITQEQIEAQDKTLKEIRRAGMIIFSTPFNKLDGFGDGAFVYTGLDDVRSPGDGNRPTLQGNGSFLRVNGLDAQTCLECHSVISNRTVPATLGMGGAGGINTSAMFQPDEIRIHDEDDPGDFNGIAEYTGRLINPPFMFGSGGVQLLANEMTRDLQDLKQKAQDYPGDVITLTTKGINFGTLVYSGGSYDNSNVQGISYDLVVRPFGRKGDNATVREFDIGAMAFHHGMQATEAFGIDNDADEDSVINEITEGDLSALSIFLTTLEKPHQKKPNKHKAGLKIFKQIGCADCHKPVLNTWRKTLAFKFTGAATVPFADTFYEIDLTKKPISFKPNHQGGIKVALFSDLKRHNMGTELAESLNLDLVEGTHPLNHEFITPRLWGVADTAPYMHDGRAFTLIEAIEMHDNPGSEATTAAQNFSGLNDSKQNKVLKFLRSLRAPSNPAADLLGGDH